MADRCINEEIPDIRQLLLTGVLMSAVNTQKSIFEECIRKPGGLIELPDLTALHLNSGLPVYQTAGCPYPGAAVGDAYLVKKADFHPGIHRNRAIVKRKCLAVEQSVKTATAPRGFEAGGSTKCKDVFTDTATYAKTAYIIVKRQEHRMGNGITNDTRCDCIGHRFRVGDTRIYKEHANGSLEIVP